MSKKDVGIVEETVINAYKVDANKRQQEVAEGVEAEGKIAELNKQKREAVIPLSRTSLEHEGLEFLEGYALALGHLNQTKETLLAVSLYYICKRQLYTEKGFASFAEYCKARGLNKSVAYEWVKNVEEFGVKDFSVLTEKIGLHQTFFREVKALPEEVKNAVVKGEKIEFNGREYDLSKDGKGLREVVKALVHNVNINQQSRGAYETHKQWNEKVAKKDDEIRKLREQIDDANMPPGDKEAIAKIERLKIQLRGIIRIWESADLKDYGVEVGMELMQAAEYAKDRMDLCLSRILELVRGEPFELDREEAESAFKEKHSEEGD